MRKTMVLLGILDDSDVEWMMRVGVKVRVDTGKVLIREGGDISSLFIVLGGQFSVNVGSRGRIATLAPGEILGEMSFIDSRPPSATVTAETESWVIDIPREAVSERLEDDVAFASRFYRAIAVFLSNRLRETVSTLGYGQQLQLDEDVEDHGEIPMHILDGVSLAGKRFAMLQRARTTTASV